MACRIRQALTHSPGNDPELQSVGSDTDMATPTDSIPREIIERIQTQYDVIYVRHYLMSRLFIGAAATSCLVVPALHRKQLPPKTAIEYYQLDCGVSINLDPHQEEQEVGTRVRAPSWSLP
ncbi:hypothetical protein Vafri_13899 [Volvox africanus]|uniref:Uncharacterized protein n=1 Tax=Volvox africanus TaxID=51714 RepID=A0A8J4BDG6_9CHLO|nr:hypothetical protein Vafri_13899 [Volvox africanus]